MPKNEKEARTCHDCGLEALEECEANFGHFPADETLLPCSCCVRNPKKQKTLWRADFWDKQWMRDSEKTPILEGPTTPHEKTLLETLHLIVVEQTQKSALAFHGSF